MTENQDKRIQGVEEAEATINKEAAQNIKTDNQAEAKPATTNEEDFGSLLEESLSETKSYKKGDEVEAKIVAIDKSYIFVGLGGKQDARAEIEEYTDKEGNLTLQVGDTLKGFIVKMTESETIISKSLSKAHANRQVLKDAFENKIPVNGKVTGIVKGGFSVDLLGSRAFCPISQMALNFVQDANQYVGKFYDFEIIEYKEKGKNIIVSRRNLLEKEREELRKKTFETLEAGQVIKGKITRLTNFGAFVDLGGIDGLVHISEMAWNRVETPSDVVRIGEEVEVKIIKLEENRISLSMKEVMENPLEKAMKELEVGQVVTAKVLRNAGFGSFVEIEAGVEGLIPISHMATGRRIKTPDEVVKIGDVVEAQIIKVDPENKQISLSLTALQPNPWDNIDQVAVKGEGVKGTIENITEHGTFIKIADGITGLLPKSKMAIAKVNYTKEDVGTEVEVRVSEIDLNKKRVSLEPMDMPERPERTERPERSEKQNRPPRQRRQKRENEEWKSFSQSSQEVPEDNPFRNL